MHIKIKQREKDTWFYLDIRIELIVIGRVGYPLAVLIQLIQMEIAMAFIFFMRK